MQYISTRGNYQPVKAGEAICLGMVPGGGLFVPESFPSFFPQDLADLPYRDLAQKILELYLDDYTQAEISEMVENAYYSGNFSPAIAPLVKTGGHHILELWHGPTAAFKDMALQIMPYELTLAVEKSGHSKETVILVATSGDTGKAALEGFKDVLGIRIIVFYPAEGVSNIQERQMLVTEGSNTHVVAVEGNFDDCQNAVKSIFANQGLQAEMDKKGKVFSSANSINWGRLLPQIIYYYFGYGQMVAQGTIKAGDAINVCVPTGNFGNILAAYYAKRMGLPLKKLVCASNKNKVLTETIEKGVYDRRRDFYKTNSPSMDILISSNFERFFFEMVERDGVVCGQAFHDLQSRGLFASPKAKENWQEFLEAGFADDETGAKAILELWKSDKYVLDPHTAVAIAVEKAYKERTGDETPVLTASTASPYKFPEAVLKALGQDVSGLDDNGLLQKLHELTKTAVHPGLIGLDQKEIRHHKRIKKADIAQTVKEICGI